MRNVTRGSATYHYARIIESSRAAFSFNIKLSFPVQYDFEDTNNGGTNHCLLFSLSLSSTFSRSSPCVSSGSMLERERAHTGNDRTNDLYVVEEALWSWRNLVKQAHIRALLTDISS